MGMNDSEHQVEKLGKFLSKGELCVCWYHKTAADQTEQSSIDPILVCSTVWTRFFSSLAELWRERKL